MGKTGWIIVVVLLFLLFREKIGTAVDSVTRPAPRDYFGGPVPGQNYATSPPVAAHSTWTDVLNNVIGAGVSIYRGVAGAPSPSAPAPSDTPIGFENWVM